MSNKSHEGGHDEFVGDLPDLDLLKPAVLPQIDPVHKHGRIALWRAVIIENEDFMEVVGNPPSLGLSVVNRRQADLLYSRSPRSASSILRDVAELEMPDMPSYRSPKPTEYGLSSSIADIAAHGPSHENKRGIYRVSLLLNHQSAAFKTLHTERDKLIELFDVSPDQQPYTPKTNHHVTVFASTERDEAMDMYDRVEEFIEEQPGNIKVRLGRLNATYVKRSARHRTFNEGETYRYRP